MIRVTLPTHLWRLANTRQEIEVELEGPPTIGSLLDTLELSYPVLRGTIRDHTTKQRRDFIRFFACGEDLSLDPVDTPLPAEVIDGTKPFRIVGAMAGG
jgi:molybdopterin synthase sulfur carrier subunit